ncbi:hypothetical protein IIA16_02455, partial [bacterium]|nr:hypothetical protein [bacterium]
MPETGRDGPSIEESTMRHQADSPAIIMTGDIEPDVQKAVLQLDGPAGLKGFPGIVMIADRRGLILE